MPDWLKKVAGVVGRLALLVLMLALVLLEIVVSFFTGQSAETAAPSMIQGLLPNWPVISLLSIPEVFATILLVPGILMLMLWKQALRNAMKLLKNAGKQAWNFLRGRKEQSGDETLWAFLQLGSAIVLLLVPIGACPIPVLDRALPESARTRTEISKETVVHREIVPVTDRIHFNKARLGPGETFAPEGTSVPESAKRMLQRTVGALNLSEKCRASVVLHGFASDEEFQNLDGSPSHLKNLKLADHRAQAVSNKLSDLPDDQRKWLTVEISNRWTPAINKPKEVKRSWKRMRKERNKLVSQGGLDTKDPDSAEAAGRKEQDQRENPDGKKRDAQLDRVVVLEWKIDEACEVPAKTEGTGTKEEELEHT